MNIRDRYIAAGFITPRPTAAELRARGYWEAAAAVDYAPAALRAAA